MKSLWCKTKAGGTFGSGLLMGLVLGAGMLIGALVAVAPQGPARSLFPEIPLHASATVSSETLAVATGLVDEEMEGLFVLDFLTGQLQCAVLNHRVARFNALFQTNVLKDLGVDPTKKRPQYLMVTGLTNFPRGSAVARLGLSVVYVVDANTGRFAAYGMPWRSEMARAGRPQQGAMILLDAGDARAAVIRE